MYLKPNLRTNIGTHYEKRRYERLGTFADQFIWSRGKPSSFAVELAIAPNHTQFIPVHSRGLSERISCVRSRERTRATMPSHCLLYRRYCTGASLSPLWWRGASGGAVEFETSLTIATGTNWVLGSTRSLAVFSCFASLESIACRRCGSGIVVG